MNKINSFVYDIYQNVKNILQKSITGLRPHISSLAPQFGFYFTLYFMIYYLMYLISTMFRNQLSKSEHFDHIAKRVLVVIAHPDDECMFFGPLIVRLTKSGKCIVYVLCLSNGNYNNIGHLRKKELWSSCQVLGIASENIALSCSALRMDGEFIWKSDIVAMLIQHHVESLNVDTIVTFDKNGVTGHQNHMSLFRAVSFLALRKWVPENCKIFVLDSLGLMRKYSSLLDCAVSLITSQNVFILSPNENKIVKQAMGMHKTQLIWYRRLYMRFSRYTYVNTFTELPQFLH